MKIRKFFRKIYYKHFAVVKHYTVVLRGGLKDEEVRYMETHPSLLSNWKKYISQDNRQKKILEIGFGNGSHLKYLSDTYRDVKYSLYGLELDKVSVFKFLKSIDANRFENVKVIREDARRVVSTIPNNTFDTIFVLYSDPWPRKRDYKRRLLNQDFVIKLLSKIKQAGFLILATDVDSYQEQIDTILSKNHIHYEASFEENAAQFVNHTPYNLDHIFATKFALKAKKEGRRNKVYIIYK